MSNTTTYKWMLRRGGRKETCPACGQRRFVPYVLTADNSIKAGREFGRCDRENNCGYHRYPNKETGNEYDNIVPVIAPQQPPIVFSPYYVRTDTSGALFEYAVKCLGEAKAREAWERYRVGQFGTDALFWQIDINGKVKAGKAIPYGTDGHRIKCAQSVRWLHKTKACVSWFDGSELQQCFFGEHLLKDNKDMKVVIVESEKTAVMMSALVPQAVWLACGGSQNLKNTKRNEVLRGCDVVLMPDNAQYIQWSAIARANGWECSMFMERNAPFTGADILDNFF